MFRFFDAGAILLKLYIHPAINDPILYLGELNQKCGILNGAIQPARGQETFPRARRKTLRKDQRRGQDQQG